MPTRGRPGILRATAAVIAVSALLLAMALGSNPAQADDIVLDGIEVVTTRPTFLESLSPVTVIKMEDRERGDQTLADVLAEIPGVQIISKGSTGQTQTVTIRGSNSRQVVVLLEGFNAADPQGGSVDLSHIPLEAVETVEVYRGTRGALAGSGSLGGVIVVRLKQGTKPQATGRLTTGFFSPFNFDSINGSLSASGNGWMFSYGHLQAQGDFDFIDVNGNRRTRENNDSAQDKLTVGYGKRLRPRVKLDLLGNMSLTRRGVPGVEQYPSTQAWEKSNTYLVGAKLKAGGWPGKSFTSRVAASWSLWQWRIMDPEPLLGFSADSVSNNHRLDLTLSTHIDTTSWLDLGVGLKGAVELVSVERRWLSNLDEQRYLGDLDISSHWGRRSFPLSGTVRARLAASDKHGFEIVPGFEAAYRPTDWLAVTLFTGRSYRLPTFDELYYESRGIKGNPDLDPEDAWGGELSVQVSHAGFQAEVAGFYQRIRDNIMFREKTANLVEAQNSGDVTAQGAEVSAGYRFSYFTVTGTFAYLDATFEETGKRLPLRSRFNGGINLRADVKRLTAYVACRFKSGYYLDRFNSRDEEWRLLFDAGASVRLGAGFKLALDFKNLSNKQDAIDSFQNPLPGQAWYVSLEKQWKGGEE